jgi:hypothetical protein
VALPIFDAAFGARGGQPALASGSAYTNGTFITQLTQGQAGRLANTLAGNAIYLCRLVGSNLSPCGALGYTAPSTYPINFFQMNPFAAGNIARLLTDEARSRYDSLQLQFRQRYGRGVSLTANYTFANSRTDRYADSASSVVDYFTLRDKGLNWGPSVYDVRHSFQGIGPTICRSARIEWSRSITGCSIRCSEAGRCQGLPRAVRTTVPVDQQSTDGQPVRLGRQ